MSLRNAFLALLLFAIAFSADAESYTPVTSPEKPAYPHVEVQVPSIQAPQKPVSEAEVGFQSQMALLFLVLLLALVAACLWFRRAEKPKKGK